MSSVVSCGMLDSKNRGGRLAKTTIHAAPEQKYEYSLLYLQP